MALITHTMTIDEEWAVVQELQGLSEYILEMWRAQWERNKGWMSSFLGPEMAVEQKVNRQVSDGVAKEKLAHMLSRVADNGCIDREKYYAAMRELRDGGELAPRLVKAGYTKSGQKVGRYLRGLAIPDPTEWAANSISSCWSEVAQALQEDCILRISARPLDLLLCSEGGIESCLGLDNTYPLGSSAYALDKATVICLAHKGSVGGMQVYSETGRATSAFDYFRKTWRAVAYFGGKGEQERADAAYLSRQYPYASEVLQKEARHMLGRMLSVVAGLAKPHWIRRSNNYSGYDLSSAFVATYKDGWSDLISVRENNTRLKFKVAERIPCPECGTATIGGCCSGERRSCTSCEERIADGEVLWHGEDPYCQECYDNEFTACHRCGRSVCQDDALSAYVRGDRESFCRSCYNAYVTICARCDEPYYDHDETHGFTEVQTSSGPEDWCKGCVEDDSVGCEDCGKRLADSDMLNDDGYCEDCREGAPSACPTLPEDVELARIEGEMRAMQDLTVVGCECAACREYRQAIANLGERRRQTLAARENANPELRQLNAEAQGIQDEMVVECTCSACESGRSRLAAIDERRRQILAEANAATNVAATGGAE